MHDCNNYKSISSRRDFLARTAMGLGAAALGTLINPAMAYAANDDDDQRI